MQSCLKLHSEPLRALMGGRQICREEDLTREVMRELLLVQGLITAVEVAEVNVRTMTGEDNRILLDSEDNSVATLKSMVEEQEGTLQQRQMLFLSDGTAHRGAELPHDKLISGPCTVQLLVKPDTRKIILLRVHLTDKNA